MGIYYSASTPGFFDSTIHATLPSDAVEITAARHRELLAAQAEGATIEPGDIGKPRIRRATATVADMRAALIRKVKREAGRRVERIAPVWQQMNDMRAASEAGAARFAAIDAVRAASGIIETEIAGATRTMLERLDVTAHATWPE